MKHTYLYPLEDGELWLWRSARMSADELFDTPPMDAPDREWRLFSGFADVVDAARQELFRRLETRDRVCVGRQYLIPGSLVGEKPNVDATVRAITRILWDAPHFFGIPYADTVSILKKTAGKDGRDSWDDIFSFCKANRCTTGNVRRVIPVWM